MAAAASVVGPLRAVLKRIVETKGFDKTMKKVF